jgi:predicted HicB family RNase H-like nuclease
MLFNIDNMDYLEYKGYKGSVEFNKADNCLFGKVLGMKKDLIIYEGDTLEDLRKDFEAGIDDYISGCEANGVKPRKPYSGILNIRISPEVHRTIADKAEEEGLSINKVISSTLERQFRNTSF